MSRRGFTLVEGLIALLVVGVLGSVWMRTLVAQERHGRRERQVEQGRVAADDVMRVLTATLQQLAADDDIQLHGDTGIAVPAPVGVALSCAQFADSLFVPIDSGAGARWDAAPDSGDVVVIESVQGERHSHVVRHAASRAPSVGGCAVPAWRLQLTAATPSALGASAVRVVRPMRLVVYRGGDGAWWWGERRCSAIVGVPCGPVQPIAGPLGAPRGGLILARDGARIMAALRQGTQVRRASVTLLP